jgi:hypothetical protein
MLKYQGGVEHDNLVRALVDETGVSCPKFAS